MDGVADVVEGHGDRCRKGGRTSKWQWALRLNLGSSIELIMNLWEVNFRARLGAEKLVKDPDGCDRKCSSVRHGVEHRDLVLCPSYRRRNCWGRSTQSLFLQVLLVTMV